MTDTDKERAEFREWYCATFNYRPQDMSDGYMLGTTAWKAWCEATRRARERDAIPAKPEQRYGCHCDLEDHMEPDECVIGTARSDDCAYAKRHAKREDCGYWQPIKVVAAGAAVTDEAKDAALVQARAWIVNNRPALTLSRQSTIDTYMALLGIIDAAIQAHTKGKA